MTDKFDENEHPRGGKGSAAGGKFVKKGTTGDAKKTKEPKAKVKKKTSEDLGTKFEALSKRMRSGADWTPEEHKAIDNYTGISFNEVNGGLRQDRLSEVSEEGKRTIAGMDSAMAKSQTLEDMFVYRGVSAQGMSKLGKLEVGAKITDKGFMSAGTGKGVAEKYMRAFEGEGGAVLEIEVPKGTRAIVPGAIAYNDNDTEVILDRGHTLEITAIEGPVVRAKVVGQKGKETEDTAGSVTIYRGESSNNRDGFFYSTSKEFAQQFTQTGQEHEVKTFNLAKSLIYTPPRPVYAGHEDKVDEAIAAAKAGGFHAVYLSEALGETSLGEKEAPSIFVFDKTKLKSGAAKSEERNGGYDLVNQIDDHALLLDATLDTPLKAKEEQALHDYTENDYLDINQSLRYGLDVDTSNLDSVFKRAKLPVDLVVYRQVDQATMDQIEAAGSYTDKAFVSTTANRDKLKGDLILKIELPKGTSAIPMGSVSSHDETEAEVLINRGQTFEVVRRDPDGLVVRVEVIKKD